ncbi:MAG: hypothetical protein ACM32O_07995 [Clostridia bacterium]
MDQRIERYYEIKQQQKMLDEEAEQLRKEILESYVHPGTYSNDGYKLTISVQERRDYDDNRLYNSLPDKELWRLLSKADTSKISGLLKLDVINEHMLDGTYEVRQIPLIRVQKQ